MRFIRKNGRVIPIQDSPGGAARKKSAASPKQGIEMRFKQTPYTAGQRFKEGAKLTGGMAAVTGGIGAVVGVLEGINHVGAVKRRLHMNNVHGSSSLARRTIQIAGQAATKHLLHSTAMFAAPAVALGATMTAAHVLVGPRKKTTIQIKKIRYRESR